MRFDYWFVKWARDPKTPRLILSILARAHHNYSIRFYVTINKSTPVRTLRHLSTHETNQYVYEHIRTNPSCPEDIILYTLARTLLRQL